MNALPASPHPTRRTLATLAIVVASLAIPTRAPAGQAAAAPGRAVPITNPRALEPFFQALDRLRRGASTADGQPRVVRAMQFGDSHTAADFQTGRLREHLQQRFGDAGIGMLLPARPWRGYAHAGVRESFDTSWPSTSLRSASSEGWVGLTGGALQLPAGAAYRVTGELRWFQVLSLALPGEAPELAPHPAPRRPKPDAGVDGEIAAALPTSDAAAPPPAPVPAPVPPPVPAPDLALPVLTLYRPSPENAAITSIKSSPVPALMPVHSATALAGGRVLHSLRQALAPSSGPLQLAVTLPSGSWLLGVELRSGRAGVIYDELGLNGGELFDLEKWQPELRRRLLADAHPDLLVVAYGTNELGRNDLDPEQFRPRAAALLRALREESHAPILVVGPPDRGAPNAARARTLRDAAKLVVPALQAAAKDAGCAFWDTRAAMGGPGSVTRWKRLGLARPDHVHLTTAGYQRLGDLQFEALMTAYDAAGKRLPRQATRR